MIYRTNWWRRRTSLPRAPSLRMLLTRAGVALSGFATGRPGNRRPSSKRRGSSGPAGSRGSESGADECGTGPYPYSLPCCISGLCSNWRLYTVALIASSHGNRYGRFPLDTGTLAHGTTIPHGPALAFEPRPHPRPRPSADVRHLDRQRRHGSSWSAAGRVRRCYRWCNPGS